MTEIEKKALALLNEVARERGSTHDSELLDRGFVEGEALCRAIEQHEAFRHEVSDALDAVSDSKGWSLHPSLWRFIIAKPDPLAEAVQDVWEYGKGCEHLAPARADQLRAAIEKRGGKIVWGEG